MSNYIPTWNPPDPPQEAVQTECPYCHGNDTEFLGYADEARNTENYVCHECEVDFTVEVEIPFQEDDMFFDGMLFWVLISSPLLVAAIWAGIWEKIDERKAR